MKRLLFILMVGLAFGSCQKSSDDDLGNWISESDFEGIPRSSAVSFVIDNNVYIGTGYNVNEDDEYMNDFWKYDPTTDSWTKIASFPGVGRTGAVSFVIDGKAYVGTGYSGKIKLKDFYMYDPTSDTWTSVADFGGSARYGAVAFGIGAYGYVGTGFDDNNLRDFYKFDPTSGTWTQIVSIGGSKRVNAATFTINNIAYVCTGVNNGIYQTDLWAFDPATETWTQKKDLDEDDSWTITRSHAVGFNLNNKGYIGLGYNSGVRSDIWEYDPTLDTWDSKTDFEGSARQEAVAFVTSKGAFIGLGHSGNYYFDDIWQFKPNEEYDEED